MKMNVYQKIYTQEHKLKANNLHAYSVPLFLSHVCWKKCSNSFLQPAGSRFSLQVRNMKVAHEGRESDSKA
jgi:hypothetical protein